MDREAQSGPLQDPFLSPQPNALPTYPVLEPLQQAPTCSNTLEPACTSCKCSCSCPRVGLYVFLLLQLLVLIGQVITLVSEHWLRYCFWDFGLLTGDSNSDRFNESGLSFSLEDEYCQEGKDEFMKGLISQYCPLFCVNIWLVGIYGIVAFVLGVFSILAALYPAVLHVLALVRPTESLLIHWLTLVPLFIWTLAWVLFYSGTLSTHFDLLGDENHHGDEDTHSELGCALWMAIAISATQVVLFFFAFFCTRKSFEKRV